MRVAAAGTLLVLVWPGVAGAQATLERGLDSLAASAFDSTGPGGVVLVARGGRPVFRKAYGFADVELGVRMRPDQLLALGSITKQFTAAAILTLVSDGQLSLETSIGDYVPELDTRGRTITVEQLLLHTSGLPNLVDREDFDVIARRRHTPEELLALTSGRPLWFEPGQGFRYSDTGYIALGLLIERVSGSSYRDYLYERLLRPLGLERIRYPDDTDIIAGRASGYSRQGDRVIHPSFMSMTVPYSAGGLFGTADDLVRWSVALEAGEVIGNDLLRRAWSPRTLPDGTPSGYGFGWKICSLAGRPTREHGGFINGFVAEATRLPTEDLDVVVLMNDDAASPDAGALARRLARFLLTGDGDIHGVGLTSGQQRSLEGDYIIAPGDVRRIFAEDGVLYSKRGDGPALPLLALEPTELALADGDGAFRLSFEMGSDGRARAVRASLRCEPAGTGRRQPEDYPHDSHAAWSPDGETIAFAGRSHHCLHLQAREAWEVNMIGAEGSGRRRLVEGADSGPVS